MIGAKGILLVDKQLRWANRFWKMLALAVYWIEGPQYIPLRSEY